jgi:hypothetical protein
MTLSGHGDLGNSLVGSREAKLSERPFLRNLSENAFQSLVRGRFARLYGLNPIS